MTPTEKQFYDVLVELRSAVKDLSSAVTVLVWSSPPGLSLQNQRISAVEKALASAGATLNELAKQKVQTDLADLTHSLERPST